MSQIPEIHNNKPLFIEFKGPDHKNTEIIVFYDCAYFDHRRRSNDTQRNDDSRNSGSRSPSRGPQKSQRDPNYENRQSDRRQRPPGVENNRPYNSQDDPRRTQFSDPNKFLIAPPGEILPIGPSSFRNQGPDSITDTNGYDVSRCEQYKHEGRGGHSPVSIPLNSLRNNKANGNDIFRGSFVVNPEKYGTVWISFKPVGEYAKGEEYQVGRFFIFCLFFKCP